MAGRFAQADAAGDNGLIDLAGEVFPQGLLHVFGEARPPVVHGQQQSLQLQTGVQPLLDQADGVHQVAEALQGVKFALHRHQNPVRRAQGVQGQQFQTGRAVDQDVFILVLDGFQLAFQQELPALHVHQLHIGPGQIRVGGEDLGVFRLQNGLLDGVVPEHHVIEPFYLALVNAHARGGVALGVAVHQQDASAPEVQGRGKVDGGGGFSDPAFLIRNGNDLSHKFLRSSPIRFWNAAIISAWEKFFNCFM